MVELWLMFILMIWFIRFFAAYDSRYMNEKYYYINNSILRVLLIDKSNFFEKTDRRKKDINKISIVGIVLYIYAAISALLAFLSYIFVPKTKVETWIIETENSNISLDTLNECSAACFLFLFFALLFFCIGIRIFQYTKICDGKFEKILFYTFSVAICIISVLVFVTIIIEGRY